MVTKIVVVEMGRLNETRLNGGMKKSDRNMSIIVVFYFGTYKNYAEC